MSLQVYLVGKTTEVQCVCAQCGHEHTRKETEELYSANATHNLVPMAEEAGIYKQLWKPEEIGISKAGQLIKPPSRSACTHEGKTDAFQETQSEERVGMLR